LAQICRGAARNHRGHLPLIWPMVSIKAVTVLY
jgi:hypothetical protein